MKKIFLTLLMMNILANAFGQNFVFNAQGKKISYQAEDMDIYYDKPGIKVGGVIQEKSLLSVLPTIVDAGFKLTTNILEKRVKQFSAEYIKQKSFLDAGEQIIPGFTFTRMLQLGKDSLKALSICLKLNELEKFKGFVYYVDAIHLEATGARAVSGKDVFDYSIEINLSIYKDGKKEMLKLAPVSISSVHFGENQYKALKHRTEVVPYPVGSELTDISLKIIESNPRKIKAERFLSVWNTYKEETQKTITGYLPQGNNSPSASVSNK